MSLVPAPLGAASVPPDLVGFTVVAALVAVGALAVAAVAAFRRRGQRPHPAVWMREPLEPWGSLVLVGLIVLPLVVHAARWLEAPVIAAAVYIAAVVVVVDQRDRIGGIRWLSVDDEGLHWRTLERGGTVPLSEVVGVTGYRKPGSVPRVQLADGSTLAMDRQPQARLVAAGIDQLSMSLRPAL